MTSRGRFLVGVLVSVVAFWLIVRGVHFGHITSILARAQYAWLVPSIGFTIAAMAVRAHRWRVLLADRVSTWRAFHVGNAGDFLNNVLPMRIGEVARAYLLSRNGDVRVMATLSTVAVERLLDVLTVCAFLLVVLPFVPRDDVLLHAGAVTAAVAVVGVLGLFVAAVWRERLVAFARAVSGWMPARIRDPLLRHGDEFLHGIQGIGARRVIIGIPWSIVAWIGWTGACWTLLFAFDPHSSWYVGVFVTCAIALGLTIPAAPSGAGLYEAAAVAALTLFDVPGDVALAYGLVMHLSSFVVVALTGLWGLNVEGQTLASVASSAQRVRP